MVLFSRLFSVLENVFVLVGQDHDGIHRTPLTHGCAFAVTPNRCGIASNIDTWSSRTESTLDYFTICLF